MALVRITEAARHEFDSTPLAIQRRIVDIFRRLATWPNVSGAKPLRGALLGNYRIRTGDYRVVFRVMSEFDAQTSGKETVVVVWRIGNRGDVYD